MQDAPYTIIGFLHELQAHRSGGGPSGGNSSPGRAPGAGLRPGSRVFFRSPRAGAGRARTLPRAPILTVAHMSSGLARVTSAPLGGSSPRGGSSSPGRAPGAGLRPGSRVFFRSPRDRAEADRRGGAAHSLAHRLRYNDTHSGFCTSYKRTTRAGSEPKMGSNTPAGQGKALQGVRLVRA